MRANSVSSPTRGQTILNFNISGSVAFAVVGGGACTATGILPVGRRWPFWPERDSVRWSGRSAAFYLHGF